MSIICLRKFRRKIYLQWGLKIADFRSLCSMLSTSMFHSCDLYVSCLRPLSTTHGYDKGRIAFWGARKRLGALAVLCGFERRACKQRGWVRALDLCFGARAFWSCFSWFVLRALVRSFRGSCFSWFVLLGSFFWSFFLWFVLFVIRAFGGSYVFFVRCFKILRGVCGKVRGFLMQR